MIDSGVYERLENVCADVQQIWQYGWASKAEIVAHSYFRSPFYICFGIVFNVEKEVRKFL